MKYTALADKQTDESLMERVQNGDQQAFSILVQRHTQRFYALAFRLCGQAGQAEDVVQDSFLKLWQRPEIWQGARSEKSGAKFTTWFYRVVSNQALDYRRKLRPQEGEAALDMIADTAPAQDEALAGREEQQALEAAINALPERQKLALNLCFYEGLSNREAAEVMEVNIKALESLLMRAKAGLKEELLRAGVITPPQPQKERRHG